jgi:hypothetical protein
MRTLYLGADEVLALRVVKFMRGKEIASGSFVVLDVLHDADCPRLHGGERCRCDPDFRLTDGGA